MNVVTFVRVIRFAGALSAGVTMDVVAQDKFPAELPLSSRTSRAAPIAPSTSTPASRGAASNSSQPRPEPMNPVPSPVTSPVANPASSNFAAVAQAEAEDFGVPPTTTLRGQPFHAPTPTQLPGGAVITTELLSELSQRKDSPCLIFDVLGGERGLPGAQNAQPAGNTGTFTDATQKQFGDYLQQVTRGNRDVAMVFYCQNVQCWLSYNAALRAINLGYRKVYWYRGGIEAWAQAGLPTFPRT